MKTDTSEKGLESLIVADMAAAGWIAGDPKDYDREYAVDLAQLRAFLPATQPEILDAVRPGQRQPDPPEVPGAAAGRDHQARRHRRAAARHQARPAPHRPVLRHALARQREGRRAVRREPLQRHPPAPLQPRRDAARARPVPVHQRPARRHVRAEEQPDQADRRRRRRAVQARPRPARAAVPVRPLHRAFRRGRSARCGSARS